MINVHEIEKTHNRLSTLSPRGAYLLTQLWPEIASRLGETETSLSVNKIENKLPNESKRHVN